MKQILHFTLGPVQGFVAQARRTRDLWAGSFLLSYLTGQAMATVLKHGGNIILPSVGTANDPKDPLLAAILGTPLPDKEAPKIGSLPNHFKAHVPDNFSPRDCQKAILDSWQRIAMKIERKYFADFLSKAQQEIWRKQVTDFWSISWIMGESVMHNNGKQDSDVIWLEQRKNWRSHQPPDQAGDKCTLMGQWQELSGYIRAQQNKDNNQQDAFWQKLAGKLPKLDLGTSERLCALALIKRLFPHVSHETIGWKLDVKSWPSTSYFAAVPWLKQIEKDNEARALALKYLDCVNTNIHDIKYSSYNNDLSCLNYKADWAKFLQLDGQLYYRLAIENDKERNYKTDEIQNEQQAKAKLSLKLKDINEAIGYAPSPFYALLMMDGDRLGALLKRQKSPEDAQRVSQALADFTNQVDDIVTDCCGKTVYAGGDDVFALLPLDCALSAAQKLRNAYLEAFRKNFIKESEKGENVSSISAGLCFAHYRTSLRAVREEAKYLLDKVAKEANGRDSIAISVLTSSGRNVEWCSSWQDSADGSHICDVLTELVASFSENDTEQATTQEDSKQSNRNKNFASTFFYNVRQRFEVLTIHQDGTQDNPQIFTDNAAQNLLLKLLVAEYKKSRATDNQRKGQDDKAIKKRMEKLLKVCRIRKGDDSRAQMDSLNMQGALLVRFLATKGEGLEA